ncbi:MAG: hypothetical protein AB7F41_02815 [Methylocystis sp.]|uniref:hypothetical protein n=1 Tax=Methylocystis sp. TaxID=1911079 RepID=UPI003D10B6AA
MATAQVIYRRAEQPKQCASATLVLLRLFAKLTNAPFSEPSGNDAISAISPAATRPGFFPCNIGAAITLPYALPLREELTSMQHNVRRSGSIAYSAPSGKHDDLIMALSLAVFGLRRIGGAPARRRAQKRDAPSALGWT